MSRTVVATLGLLLVAVLGWAAYHLLSRREDGICRACRRPVHPHSRTTGLVGGKPVPFCCPACAFSEGRQLGKAVPVVELTDYHSGQALQPDHAWMVSGSDANPCRKHDAHLSPDKQPLRAHFDRCSPGLLAFSRRDLAEAFARDHGGRVQRFRELTATSFAAR